MNEAVTGTAPGFVPAKVPWWRKLLALWLGREYLRAPRTSEYHAVITLVHYPVDGSAAKYGSLYCGVRLERGTHRVDSIRDQLIAKVTKNMGCAPDEANIICWSLEPAVIRVR